MNIIRFISLGVVAAGRNMQMNALKCGVLGALAIVMAMPGYAATVASPFIHSSTTLGYWHPILLPGTVTTSYGVGDFEDDQQTGAQFSNASDIVGDTQATNPGANPGAYIAFHGEIGTNPNGMLAFRVRLGTQDSSAGGYFKEVVHFGIDGDGNGTIDVYVSYVNNSGNAQVGNIKIFKVIMPNNPIAGSVVGDSPNNSTPSGSSFFQVAAVENSTFSYRPVVTNENTANTNHGGTGAVTNVDAATDTNVDYFLSYGISWSTLATQMQSLAGVTINPDNLRFFVATAKQDNQINQDIYGLKGDFTNPQKDMKWTQLGLITGTYSLDDIVTTPEPGTIGLCGAALIGVWALQRRKTRNGSRS
jgi:hypothetical protein